MARDAKGEEGKRRRRRGPVDAATLLGLFCVAGLFGIWYVSKKGWDETVEMLFGEEEVEEPRATGWKPPTDDVVEGQPYEGPPWELDERWSRGVQAGNQGLADLQAAYERHADEGDPFRLKHEADAARALLQSAVADLEALRADYADSKAACFEIDKLLRRYGKGLERGPKQF